LNAARRLIAAFSDDDVAMCDTCRPDWTLIEQLTAESGDPRSQLIAWTTRLLAHIARAHPERHADTAAALMRRSPSSMWTVTNLASRLSLSPALLRDRFRRRFAMSIGEYLHLLRVSRAVEICRGDIKIETVADELGYRSKKDFYAALARWTAQTPADLRKAGDEQRRRWRERVQAAMDGRGATDRVRVDDQRRRRRARNHRTASVPPTSAAPPRSATPA
jgi:AraC-like DNA-binding protein